MVSNRRARLDRVQAEDILGHLFIFKKKTSSLVLLNFKWFSDNVYHQVGHLIYINITLVVCVRGSNA